MMMAELGVKWSSKFDGRLMRLKVENVADCEECLDGSDDC